VQRKAAETKPVEGKTEKTGVGANGSLKKICGTILKLLGGQKRAGGSRGREEKKNSVGDGEQKGC